MHGAHADDVGLDSECAGGQEEHADANAYAAHPADRSGHDRAGDARRGGADAHAPWVREGVHARAARPTATRARDP